MLHQVRIASRKLIENFPLNRMPRRMNNNNNNEIIVCDFHFSIKMRHWDLGGGAHQTRQSPLLSVRICIGVKCRHFDANKNLQNIARGKFIDQNRFTTHLAMAFIARRVNANRKRHKKPR